MTFEYYKDQEWSQDLFEAIEDYADNTTINVGESNIDDINAGKIFFELHREAVNRNLPEKAEIYRQKAKFCFDQIINSQIRIQPPLAGVNGFWHKKIRQSNVVRRSFHGRSILCRIPWKFWKYFRR